MCKTKATEEWLPTKGSGLCDRGLDHRRGRGQQDDVIEKVPIKTQTVRKYEKEAVLISCFILCFYGLNGHYVRTSSLPLSEKNQATSGKSRNFLWNWGHFFHNLPFPSTFTNVLCQICWRKHGKCEKGARVLDWTMTQVDFAVFKG